MGFLWLLFKMLFLMLLSAVGGYFLRKWIERSQYKDVTVSYSKALAKHEATKSDLDNLTAQHQLLQQSVDSKLDGVLQRFSPIEEKLSDVDLSAKMASVEDKISAIRTQITSLPKPIETDLSPVLGAISKIRIPEAEAPNFDPVLEAISSIHIPESKPVDLNPVLSAVDAIKIPEQRETDLSPVINAIKSLLKPEQKETDFTPVLSAIKNIRIPESEKVDLSPVLNAVHSIRIPDRKELNTLPLMTAIRNIKIPEQKETDLSPLLIEIKSLKDELAKSQIEKPQIEKKVVAPTTVQASSKDNKDVIANRLGSRGNRLRRAAFGQPDDLKIISGVGPKLEKMLHGIGVYYYWQVADWTDDDVQEADDLLDAFKGRIERDGWVIQARKLAALSTAAKRP